MAAAAKKPSRCRARLRSASAALRAALPCSIKESKTALDSNALIGGGFYHKEVLLLDALLDQTPADVVEAEFRRVCASSVRDSWGPEDELDKSYDHVLMVALFDRSSERKDTQRLTTLLSYHCPQNLGYAASEFYLASRWPKAIECFFDCYTAAKSAGVQKDVVSCLGRAFPFLRSRFPADHEFVQETRNWYMSNRSNLQVNSMYVHLA